MRALDFILRAALFGLLSLPLIGCGADGGSGDACAPDTTQACNGDDGCLGSQTCEASGAGWGDCDCSISPYPDAGTTDAGTTDAGMTDAGTADGG